MRDRSTSPEAGAETFDGGPISRADREFLASLSDHPLMRDPLYSVPPPPRPNYAACTTLDHRTAAPGPGVNGLHAVWALRLAKDRKTSSELFAPA